MKFMLTGSENSRTSLVATSLAAPTIPKLPILIRGVVQLLSHRLLNPGELYAKIELSFVLRAVVDVREGGFPLFVESATHLRSIRSSLAEDQEFFVTCPFCSEQDRSCF
ncbi:hypothetical protein QTI51_36750 [Variovorax sp. J22G73]|uniref:hypothetical protein n=1 Tax=unclassified Variovorax TaxID=663243 RepID=UPI002578E7D3|nr:MULTISPECIES: hypothetical protein [unclassified Variovorax]MDM0010540.1 hypothetical protein [Variovorax sp. J22R203]MDM0102878.1 hypothetical protein [Variovorax sp. J22G73]